MPRIGRVLEAEQWGEPGIAGVRAKSLLHRSNAVGGAGKYYYVEFNGKTSVINCGGDASLTDIPATRDMTVDFWFRANTVSSEFTMFLAGKFGTTVEPMLSIGWACFLYAGGNLGFGVLPTADLTTDQIIVAGRWYHVACAYNYINPTSGMPYAALNGVWCTYDTQDPQTLAYRTDVAYDLTIGRCADLANPLDGDISWLRVSDELLWTPGVDFSPPRRCPPPHIDSRALELWKMDEGSGAVAAATILSPTNDGAMTGCTWYECA